MLFLPDVRDYVRSEFVTDNPGFLSDREIDRWANEALYKYFHIMIAADAGYFEQVKYLNLVAGQEAIALPSAYSSLPASIQETRIERVLPTGNIPLRFRRRYDEVNPISSSVSGFAYLPTYDFRGGNLILEPPPSGSETGAASPAGGLLLLYKVIPPRLESALCWAAAGNSTLFLNATTPTSDPRAEYYTGARVYIYSGTGAGQMNTITAYTGFVSVGSGNNFKCTMGSVWGTNPDTTSVYCILMPDDFMESFHDLIPLYATKKAFAKERSMGTARAYDGIALKEKEKQLIDMLPKRTSARKFVQCWNPELS